jgi:hypothetical protein
MVQGAVAADCRENTHGHGHGDGDQHSRRGELERRRHSLQDEAHRRLLVPEGVPEISMNHPHEEPPVLGIRREPPRRIQVLPRRPSEEERVIESHQLAKVVDVRLGGIGRHQEDGGVPRQVEDDENDDRDPEEDQERLPHATDQIANHRFSANLMARQASPGTRKPLPTKIVRRG